MDGDTLTTRGNGSGMDGGAGNDRLFGSPGSDNMYGGEGNDWVYGGNGTDYLNGGKGIDHLYGQGGNDELDGGRDFDTDYLTGGTSPFIWGGGDTFVKVSFQDYTASGGQWTVSPDIVTDFSTADGDNILKQASSGRRLVARPPFSATATWSNVWWG